MNYEMLFLIAIIGSLILLYLAFSFGQSYYRWKSIHMLGELMNDGLFRLLGGEAPNNGNTTSHKKSKKSSSGFGFTTFLFLVAGISVLVMWGLQNYAQDTQSNEEEQELEQEDNRLQTNGSTSASNPRFIIFGKGNEQPKKEASKPKRLNQSPSYEGKQYDQYSNKSTNEDSAIPFRYALQFGAFSSKSGARQLASQLLEKCGNRQLYLYYDSISGQTKVLLGGFDSKDEAKAFGRLFEEEHYPVRTDNLSWRNCSAFNIDST